jgi:tetratricopeptide (TPR) repeat protein
MARTAVALDPLWPHMRMLLGTLLVGLGQFDEGLAELRKANEIDPRLPGPYSQIGRFLAWVHGRLDDAIPWFEKAAELDSGSPGRAAAVAALLLDLQDEAGAERWLGRARSRGSSGIQADDVEAMLQLYRGRHGQALELARRAFKSDPVRPLSLWPLTILRDADLQAGQLENARNRYASAFPELVSGDPRQLVYANYRAAIDLAPVLQIEGDHTLAGQLLDRSTALITKAPRMSEFGYRIDDVRMHALRGQRRLALQALRAAAQSGWRGPYWRYHRDFDPALAAIRDDPEFKAVFAEIERDMARQRAALAARPKDAPLDLDPSR